MNYQALTPPKISPRKQGKGWGIGSMGPVSKARTAACDIADRAPETAHGRGSHKPHGSCSMLLFSFPSARNNLKEKFPV